MKQVKEIRMGAYIYNGQPLNMTDFRAFQGFPQTYRVWNVDYQYESDFLGGSFQQTLTGYRRGNPMGHRLMCRIDLNNSNSTESARIRDLLNTTASRYSRDFYVVTIQSRVGAVMNISNTGLPSNYFRGLTLLDPNSEEWLIVASTATTLTLSGTPETPGGTGLSTILAKQSHPTIIGVSFDNTDGNMQYFNIENNSMGLKRELTVGNQIIQLNLAGVFAEPIIKSGIVI